LIWIQQKILAGSWQTFGINLVWKIEEKKQPNKIFLNKFVGGVKDLITLF